MIPDLSRLGTFPAPTGHTVVVRCTKYESVDVFEKGDAVLYIKDGRRSVGVVINVGLPAPLSDFDDYDTSKWIPLDYVVKLAGPDGREVNTTHKYLRPLSKDPTTYSMHGTGELGSISRPGAV